MEIIRRNALDAIASNERIQAYAQFEIYAKSRETLTDKEIAELIGFKPLKLAINTNAMGLFAIAK